MNEKSRVAACVRCGVTRAVRKDRASALICRDCTSVSTRAERAVWRTAA